MIDAARLRGCADAFDLLRTLGYQVKPVAILSDEWRAAGIDIGWSDRTRLFLATRARGADVYVVDTEIALHAALRFLRSLRAYNVITKPVLFSMFRRRFSIYDLSSARELRRLDVDLDAPSPHAIDRLNLLAAREGVDIVRVFERALDREALTRQFFERFRTSVQQMTAALREAFRSETAESAAAEALLILSRILFLYFVQQKGWLNGERRFLLDRLDESLRDGREYFATVLAPLFFGCLNTPIAQRSPSAKRLGEIPYLNGGLFDPSPFERRHPDIHLSNELMQDVIERTFEPFAFTIDESDASGMHVDPEMLGKVFESLMAADERAASGSFYTPRAIVDVLTERAIREWLGTEGDAIARLARLSSITILDPACGSGAFLLSALSVIERLSAEMSATAGVAPPSRQSIIERSLYGVDLKPEAVRLCELRLWLAIVAGEHVSADAVPPLPNLDRNILQGHSLLSPTDFLGNARGDVYREWLFALRAHSDLVARYRTAPQHERPALARLLRASDCRLATELLAKAIDVDEEELRQITVPQRDLFGHPRRIDSARCADLQRRIRENRRVIERVELGEVDFFSFDVHFAHVMTKGFDVVAGNPPWVRNSRIDPRMKRMYADRYRLFRGSRRNTAFHQPDLSVVFFERALSLAGPDGVVSMLVPAKLTNAAYASPLRRAAEAETIVAIHDWSDGARRHFDADTFPLGITVRRRPPASQSRVDVTTGGESFQLPQRSLALFGSEWMLVPPPVARIFERLQREHPPLVASLGRTPVMGVKTGDNGSFFIDVKRVRAKAVETADGIHIPLRYVCRCVRGRDVRRWTFESPAWMLWPPAGGWLRIPRWLERLALLRGVAADDLQLAYVRPDHLGTKVVWKDVSRGIAAAVLGRQIDGVPLIPNQTLYALPAKSSDEAEVLAAMMNSTVVNALAVAMAERAKDYHFRYFGRTIARIPFPQITPSSASWRLLSRAREDADGAVAALYGVTPAELDQLTTFVQRRLGYAVHDD